LNYYLYRIARIIAGHVEDKIWVLMQGLRNSGKGVLSDLLQNSLESYVKTTNSGNFKYKKTNVDEAKSLSWLVNCRFCRLIISQEIDISEKINGEMLKKFSSGGDMIEARLNFSDEIVFKMQCSLMICSNDMPEIQPADAMEFCDEFQMKSKFIDSTFDEKKKLNTYKYYDKDPLIKTEFLHLCTFKTPN
jgi:phage/plasmid-associated DNA primase